MARSLERSASLKSAAPAGRAKRFGWKRLIHRFPLALLLWALPLGAQEAGPVAPPAATAAPTPVLSPSPEPSVASPDTAGTARAGGLQVAFINLRRVMGEAPQNRSIHDSLDREFKDDQKALVDSQAHIADLERQLFALDSNDDSEALRREIAELRRDQVQNEAKYRNKYNLRRNEEIIKLQKLIMEEIVQLAKERHYDVILNDTGVLYVNENADLTLELIQRLGAKGQL